MKSEKSYVLPQKILNLFLIFVKAFFLVRKKMYKVIFLFYNILYDYNFYRFNPNKMFEIATKNNIL